MIVKNTTDKEISVTIKGATYTVPANGENPNVNDEHATHWKTHIHHFIELREGSDTQKVTPEVVEEEVAEEAKEEVTEPTEDVVAEEVEVKQTKKTNVSKTNVSKTNVSKTNVSKTK